MVYSLSPSGYSGSRSLNRRLMGLIRPSLSAVDSEPGTEAATSVALARSLIDGSVMLSILDHSEVRAYRSTKLPKSKNL